MKSEKWKVKSEKWKVKDERWKMKDERWKRKTENGKRKTENGKRKTENGKLKTENWKLKTENWKVNFLTALRISLAPNLLSKQCKYDAFVFGLVSQQTFWILSEWFQGFGFWTGWDILRYFPFRTKFSNAESTAYKFKIYLSLECGIYNAQWKMPTMDSTKTYSHCRHFFVSGSR